MSKKPTPGVQPLLDQSLCFAVYSAGLAFNRLYKPILDPLGLTYPQYLVMMALWEKDGQGVGELGDLLFLESNTLTPLIKRLEAAGLVKRARDTQDERQVRVTLTVAGRDLLKQASCVPMQVVEASGMSVEQLVRLRNSVAGLRDNLRAAVDADA
jgi:DNA-binding MarR family transcriptional regulator